MQLTETSRNPKEAEEKHESKKERGGGGQGSHMHMNMVSFTVHTVDQEKGGIPQKSTKLG